MSAENYATYKAMTKGMRLSCFNYMLERNIIGIRAPKTLKIRTYFYNELLPLIDQLPEDIFKKCVRLLSQSHNSYHHNEDFMIGKIKKILEEPKDQDEETSVNQHSDDESEEEEISDSSTIGLSKKERMHRMVDEILKAIAS